MSLTSELEELKALKDAGQISEPEFQQSRTRLLEATVRRIEAVHEKPPSVWPRWGLPPVKVIGGVVQSFRLSSPGSKKSMALIQVAGQRVEFSSSIPISIDLGDRVTFGGYQRDDSLLALAYYNESNGTHSDLDRLRQGYRFLFFAGRLSALLGIAALVGLILLLTHRAPVMSFRSPFWRYLPYGLSVGMAAASAYFGVGLCLLGKRAREFHHAMTSAAAHPLE